MKGPKGMFVPIVTPFREDQSIDFDAFRQVIDYTIENGVDGILVAGGTGEYHMMRLEEQKEVIRRGCEYVAGRVPVIAGVGTSTPSVTIEMANFAADCGARWGLVLPPYYQPTTRQGILDFYREIAGNSRVGIMIYNNPLATGVDLDPQLLYELARIENVVSLKDTADLLHTSAVVALVKDMEDFTVFQGYEHAILPGLLIGAEGGFAILMNALPKEYARMYALARENRWAEAVEINLSMARLYTAMEAEPYPAPVKAMMRMLGLPAGCVRKPLVDASEGLKADMREALLQLGYQISNLE